MKSGVFGDREVGRALRELGRTPPAIVVDRSAIEAMEPMRKDAVSKARALRNYVGKYSAFFPQPKGARKGGHADQGIVTRKVGSRQGRRSYWLGGARRAVKLLHLLEFGTAPHWQPNFKGGFMHPGARPKPVLAPAYEAHADGVIKGFGVAMWRHLERQAMMLSRSARKRQ